MMKAVVAAVLMSGAAALVTAQAPAARSPKGQAPSAQAPVAKPAVDLDILRVQVVLDHLGFGPGVLDGRGGIALVNALKGFQESRGLPVTGKTDSATVQALSAYRNARPTVTLALSRAALTGPFINPFPKDYALQAKLPTLGYRSPMEKLAEMFHTTPEVIMALNSPQTMLTVGTKVVFPNALPSSRAYDAKLTDDWRATLNMLNVDANQPKADHIIVDKSDGVLRVMDENDKLIAQFTATMGSEHDPLPLGDWTIKGADYNPKFHYNPALFWDAKKGDDKELLPAGPNGPVGVVWLDLSKDHYGIHGTPNPETIGRAESHGCIRLTNWDAARLSVMVKPGTKAVFRA